MLFTNPDYKGNPRTYLISPVLSIGDDVVVKVGSTTAIEEGSIVLLGTYGSENAEIARVKTIVSPKELILHSAVRTHETNTNLRVLDYNVADLYTATSENASKTVQVEDIPFDPTSTTTQYNITELGLTGFLYIQFKNSFTGEVSAFSDTISLAGKKYDDTVSDLVQNILDEAQDPNATMTSKAQVMKYINQFSEMLVTKLIALDVEYFLRVQEFDLTGRESIPFDEFEYHMYKVKRVEYNSGGTQWKRVFPEAYNASEFSVEKDYQDNPSHGTYYFLHRTLNIRKASIPTGSKIRVTYYYLPRPVDSSGDIPELTTGFSDAVESYCLYKIHRRRGDGPSRDRFKNDLDFQMRDMIRSLRKRQADSTRGVHVTNYRTEVDDYNY